MASYAHLLQCAGVAGEAMAHVGSTGLQGNSSLLLGIPIVSFTSTMYHGQLRCCAAVAPSDDHLNCFRYHGFQILHLFSAQSLPNVRSWWPWDDSAGSVTSLETPFLQHWQVSGAVMLMFSYGNIIEAGGWKMPQEVSYLAHPHVQGQLQAFLHHTDICAFERTCIRGLKGFCNFSK